jgi:polygalacturonase
MPAFATLTALLTGLFITLAATARAAEKDRFDVTRFGAVADGRTLNTAAIQKAVDAAAQQGGGTVVIPAGRFLSGSIFLKDRVALHLEKNAVLLGSPNIADYPKRNTRIEGHFEPWRMALVNAENLNGLRISGEGTLDGNGISYWAAFWQRRRENPKCTNLEVERPRLVFISRCRNARIEGVCLRYSGFWNLHLYDCEDVTIENLSILAPTRHTKHRNYMTPELLKAAEQETSERRSPVKDNILGPSTDGIDIDSSRRITIRRCYISVNDDNIALKGSKGPLAGEDRDSPPVEDILIEDCDIGDGNGLLTCGSEATVVRNVTVRNCRIHGDATMLTLKLRPDTPQRYENIVIENVRFLGGTGRLMNVAPWTQFFDLKGHAPPSRTVSGVTLRDISGALDTLGTLRGNPGDTLERIRLEDLDLQPRDESFPCGILSDSSANRVSINGKPWKLPQVSAN